MRRGASLTAQMVALARGLGVRLPAEAQLVVDPWGLRFAAMPLRAMAALGLPVNPLLRSLVVYMQVRTRVIDDALRAFVAGGGRQVVLLGAGFDCRAVRCAAELGSAVVYEIDHPLTQARKRAVVDGHPSSPVRYLAWNFEDRSIADLPAALAAIGHDSTQPTLTIWEGVTMYLSARAIEASVAAVRAWSGAGSPFIISLIDRKQLETPTPVQALSALGARTLGEPFTFGWSKDELPGWLQARGFQLAWHHGSRQSADGLLPPQWARRIELAGRHSSVALAHRSAAPVARVEP